MNQKQNHLILIQFTIWRIRLRKDTQQLFHIFVIQLFKNLTIFCFLFNIFSSETDLAIIPIKTRHFSIIKLCNPLPLYSIKSRFSNPICKNVSFSKSYLPCRSQTMECNASLSENCMIPERFQETIQRKAFTILFTLSHLLFVVHFNVNSYIPGLYGFSYYYAGVLCHPMY